MAKTALQKHIESLISSHGGLRATARALKIDPAYLGKMQSGEKRNPSAITLKKLGLKRVETVIPIQ